MGGRGRAPTPTALKKLRGNPGKRALNKAEPMPKLPEGVPPAPKFLSTDAKREWNLIAPQLHQLGLLTNLDLSALAGYCEIYALWRRASTEAKKKSLTYLTLQGGYKTRPEIKLVLESLAMMKAYMAEFGMTPAARSRLKVEQPNEEKSLAQILFEGSQRD